MNSSYHASINLSYHASINSSEELSFSFKWSNQSKRVVEGTYRCETSSTRVCVVRASDCNPSVSHLMSHLTLTARSLGKCSRSRFLQLAALSGSCNAANTFFEFARNVVNLSSARRNILTNWRHN